jgi:hypothetical protein
MILDFLATCAAAVLAGMHGARHAYVPDLVVAVVAVVAAIGRRYETMRWLDVLCGVWFVVIPIVRHFSDPVIVTILNVTMGLVLVGVSLPRRSNVFANVQRESVIIES